MTVVTLQRIRVWLIALLLSFTGITMAGCEFLAGAAVGGTAGYIAGNAEKGDEASDEEIYDDEDDE